MPWNIYQGFRVLNFFRKYFFRKNSKKRIFQLLKLIYNLPGKSITPQLLRAIARNTPRNCAGSRVIASFITRYYPLHLIAPYRITRFYTLHLFTPQGLRAIASQVARYYTLHLFAANYTLEFFVIFDFFQNCDCTILHLITQ